LKKPRREIGQFIDYNQLEELLMAIIRPGNKAVLLVVDVQEGVMQNVWNPIEVIDNIVAAIEKARYQGVPVIIADAHTTETIDIEEGVKIEANNVIRELIW